MGEGLALSRAADHLPCDPVQLLALYAGLSSLVGRGLSGEDGVAGARWLFRTVRGRRRGRYARSSFRSSSSLTH